MSGNLFNGLKMQGFVLSNFHYEKIMNAIVQC